MVCPRCEQDYLRTFVLPPTIVTGLVCPDCDAVWLVGADLPYPGWADRSILTEEHGLDWHDMVLGPSTGQDAPPADVHIRRRVQPRWSGQPLVYVIGDMGKPRTPCAYCPDGLLVGARLRSTGERFFYCKNCEAVWPKTEVVATQSPTFLDPYLRSHDAEWTDVEDAVGSAD